jgi:hypothetical protein
MILLIVRERQYDPNGQPMLILKINLANED